MYHVQHGDDSYVCREIRAETDSEDSFHMGHFQAARTDCTHRLRLDGITAINDGWLPINGGSHDLFVTEPLRITIADLDIGDDS